MWLRDRQPIFFHPFEVKLNGFLNKRSNLCPGFARGDTPWQVGHICAKT